MVALVLVNLEAVVQVMPRDTLAARDWFKYPGCGREQSE